MLCISAWLLPPQQCTGIIMRKWRYGCVSTKVPGILPLASLSSQELCLDQWVSSLLGDCGYMVVALVQRFIFIFSSLGLDDGFRMHKTDKRCCEVVVLGPTFAFILLKNTIYWNYIALTIARPIHLDVVVLGVVAKSLHFEEKIVQNPKNKVMH